MIKQCAVTDIESRSECNPYDSTGFLPLIVAPMYSCVNKHNAHIFLENKIKICMPRKEYMDETYINCSNENYFDSYSLQEFIENFINSEDGFLNDSNYNKVKTSVCIDTAAGHLKKLHDAIRKAKEIHGDKLIIMAGNVASVETFVELAKTGVDYIRVGIGGGGGCNTTSNTGVGQEDLGELIKFCDSIRKENPKKNIPQWYQYSVNWSKEDTKNINKVKIVADGISSYIRYCQKEYGFNDNGYAAINKLLFAGADLVMIGKLFAQCVESTGDKGQKLDHEVYDIDFDKITEYFNAGELVTQYAGMSTQAAQKMYKALEIHPSKVEESKELTSYALEISGNLIQNIKPSEGSVQWIPVRWSLSEWLNGSQNQDESPYLMGWVNSIKSAMRYTGKKTL